MLIMKIYVHFNTYINILLHLIYGKVQLAEKIYISTLLAVLCQLLSNSGLLAQSLVINGNVIDGQTKEPLPFVHIFINPNIGTITNIDGEFELKVPSEIKGSILLQFSSIGYNTLYLNLDVPNYDTIKISLMPGINVLDEVIVTAEDNIDSAYLIMENVLANIRKNYPTRKYGMEAFYREANVSDTSYSRLIEAQILIADKGYNQPIEKTEFEVLQMRKTEDNRGLSWRQSLFEWLYSINGVFKIVANDRLKKSVKPYNMTDLIENVEGWLKYEQEKELGAIRFLSEEFINGADLSIEGVIETVADTSYVVRFITKKLFTGRQGRGLIYINKADWAIVEIRSEVVKPDTVHYYQLDYTLKNSRAYYQTIIKYQKHKGNYYLSYIKSNSIGTNSRGLIGGRDHTLFYKSKGKAGTIYQENELYITSVIPYRKIKKKNRLDKEEDIYDADIKNDTIFWAQYNFPLLNPLTDKMRNDLKTVNNEIFIK